MAQWPGPFPCLDDFFILNQFNAWTIENFLWRWAKKHTIKFLFACLPQPFAFSAVNLVIIGSKFKLTIIHWWLQINIIKRCCRVLPSIMYCFTFYYVSFRHFFIHQNCNFSQKDRLFLYRNSFILNRQVKILIRHWC